MAEHLRQTYVAFETAASCITALSIASVSACGCSDVLDKVFPSNEDSGWPVSSAPGQMLQLPASQLGFKML